MAELSGHEFCYKEMQIVIQVVGNTLFGTKWKLSRELDKDSSDIDSNEMEDESEFDADTLSSRKNMWRLLKKIEAYSLKQVSKKWGALLIHTTDSTTWKVVEPFAPAGIHINRNGYLPYQHSPLHQTRKNTADSVATDFRLLEAASGIPAEQIYSKIGVHMTDSTYHNKGIAENFAEPFHKREISGQIFCDSHTTLGFDKGIPKTICMIENKMGIQNIFTGFL